MILALEGEPIVYLENGTTAKTMTAVIDRSPKEVAEVRSAGSPAGSTAYGRTKYVLTLANDMTKGMTSIRQGQDKVQCKRMVSDAQHTTFVVSSILTMDAGGWQVEITA